MPKFSVTYDIVTPESAAHGDFAECEPAGPHPRHGKLDPMPPDSVPPNVAAYTFKKLLRLLNTMRQHGERTLPEGPPLVRCNAHMMLGMTREAIEIIEDATPWTIELAEAEFDPTAFLARHPR